VSAKRQNEAPPVDASEREETPSRRRGLAVIAADLWHQRPGPRAERPAAPARTAKEVVDGLDVWELRLSIAATVVEGLLTPLFYWYFRTHGSLAVRHAASEFLITGIITTAILLLGTLFKRRALVGFAAFMTGMAWLTYGSLYFALVFLVFGGWLILRVMRKQKQDRAVGKTPEPLFGSRRRAAAPATPTPVRPKASKRYTPPKRATTKGRAVAGRRAASGPRR
jgi:hypothetical protein